MMTKLEFWRKVKENGGGCCILCNECPYYKKGDGCTRPDCNTKKDAESYIKRYEQKYRKKDLICDTTKKVEEPKPVEEPTPLEIAKMIRDNGYRCVCLPKSYNCYDRMCPLYDRICGREDEPLRKKLIDDYISANEPKPVETVGIDNDDVTFAKPTVKENLSVPQPIKFDDPVPEYVYTITKYGIFKFAVARYHREETKVKDGPIIYKELVFAFEGDKCLDGTKRDVTIDINNCYRTLEEAVIVAKKLWGGK